MTPALEPVHHLAPVFFSFVSKSACVAIFVLIMFEMATGTAVCIKTVQCSRLGPIVPPCGLNRIMQGNGACLSAAL